LESEVLPKPVIEELREILYKQVISAIERDYTVITKRKTPLLYSPKFKEKENENNTISFVTDLEKVEVNEDNLIDIYNHISNQLKELLDELLRTTR